VNIFLKILSIPIMAAMLAFVFLGGVVQLTEGYHPLNPLIDTQHPEGYTIEKFDQVKIGDTKGQVYTLLGMPLYTTTESGITTLHYTGDGKLLNTYGEGPGRSYGDFAWYRSSVSFDKSNKVVSIDKGWSHD